MQIKLFSKAVSAIGTSEGKYVSNFQLNAAFSQEIICKPFISLADYIEQ